MALADIDAAAILRRIQEVADASRKAFEDHAQRSAEIDAASREAAAKEEADLKAVQERRAELEARKAVEKAARVAAEREKQEQEKPKAPPKPATLSLGAEEFTLAREARQAAPTPPAPTPAAPPPPAPPESSAEEERPNRTLKLGARDEQDDAPKQDKPARKRPPRPDTDDDMSGRTWLR
jgi:hypothetical protein